MAANPPAAEELPEAEAKDTSLALFYLYFSTTN